MSSSITDKKVLEEMLQAACHFGHKVSKWNPKMSRFIYTKRDGIHIFDLTKTQEALAKACAFLEETVAAGKQVLLVSTKLHTARLLSEKAKELGLPYVTRKWIPGLLTNFDTVRKRIKYFKDLKEQQKTNEWDKYTKKERLELTRTMVKLEDAFGGVEHMNKLPDVVVLLDCVRDTLVLKEAKRLKIATVGICDSNADPDMVTYPIPGNDDAVKALAFFAGKFTEAISRGMKEQSTPQVEAKVEKE